MSEDYGKKYIIKNKKKYLINFKHNKRKHSIESSSKGEFCLNIAIVSYFIY